MAIGIGVTFNEANVLVQSLKQVSFDDPDMETERVAAIKYLSKAIWHAYPYDAEAMYDQSGGEKFPTKLKES